MKKWNVTLECPVLMTNSVIGVEADTAEEAEEKAKVGKKFPCVKKVEEAPIEEVALSSTSEAYTELKENS